MTEINKQTVRKIALIISVVYMLCWSPAYAEEYTFDLSEIEKKPYHIGGYAELKPVLFGLDKDASLYRLNFYNRDEGAAIEEYNGTLQLEGSMEKGIARLFVRTNMAYKNHIPMKTWRQSFTKVFCH